MRFFQKNIWTETWRLKVLRESDYEPVLSFRMSLLDGIVAASALLFFTAFFTFFLVAFTPIREYLPGYSDPSLRRDLVALQGQTDSLLQEVDLMHRWTLNVRTRLSENQGETGSDGN